MHPAPPSLQRIEIRPRLSLGAVPSLNGARAVALARSGPVVTVAVTP